MHRTLFAAVAVIGLLSACASGTDSDSGSTPTAEATVTATPDPDTGVALDLTAGSTVIGLPTGVDPAANDATAGALRTEEDGLIAVITFGSSTCPQVPEPLATGADGTVTVAFPEPTDGPCTLDYVPATTVVALPDGGDTGGDLTVTIGDFGSVTLPAESTGVEWVAAG
ncbi:hypothetical protein [Cellulomonas sp. NPDC089187]|uniref:hypothetical protein n=1 Tax=Cellulomonas sp. NPDC089187 TaxID=3154970 RepID=UPI00342F0A05